MFYWSGGLQESVIGNQCRDLTDLAEGRVVIIGQAGYSPPSKIAKAANLLSIGWAKISLATSSSINAFPASGDKPCQTIMFS